MKFSLKTMLKTNPLGSTNIEKVVSSNISNIWNINV
jgi:hypothetical protein